jgi:quinol monooxygenase YgiN
VNITRISEFQAKDGQTQGLRDFLNSIVPTIAALEGCRSCRLLQDQEDERRFVVIELWESLEAHKASVKEIPPEQLEEIMRLVASPPQGRYFAEEGELGDPRHRRLYGP